MSKHHTMNTYTVLRGKGKRILDSTMNNAEGSDTHSAPFIPTQAGWV
jgi:hypothetical protein